MRTRARARQANLFAPSSARSYSLSESERPVQSAQRLRRIKDARRRKKCVVCGHFDRTTPDKRPLSAPTTEYMKWRLVLWTKKFLRAQFSSTACHSAELL